MATGQSLLDRMELLNQELQLQSGENDVTRGLLALNIAQDYYESLAANRDGLLGGNAIGTVTTSASTESTTFPSGVLRIDRLQYVDPTTSRPAWEIVPTRRVGGHATSFYWPWQLIATSTTGKPRRYYTNGTNIYWDPLPDATHTVRYSGFSVAADLTAGGTFAYPDIVMLPLASFAVRLYKLGLDDSQEDMINLARSVFNPVLDTLANFQRDGAVEFQYTQTHDT